MGKKGGGTTWTVLLLAGSGSLVVNIIVGALLRGRLERLTSLG